MFKGPNQDKNEGVGMRPHVDISSSDPNLAVSYTMTAQTCRECVFLDYEKDRGMICARVNAKASRGFHVSAQHDDDHRPFVGPNQRPPRWCPLRAENIGDDGYYRYVPFDEPETSQ